MQCKVRPTTFDEKLLCVLSCHASHAPALCSACSGASCAKNLMKTKCEIWNAVINEQENLDPHCLHYRNYVRLTDLRVVCGKRMSFVCFSIRLEEKINADVNQRHCLWSCSEMCFEFCVHDLVNYPIFIRTEMSQRRRQRSSKLKMYEKCESKCSWLSSARFSPSRIISWQECWHLSTYTFLVSCLHRKWWKKLL